MNQLPRWAEIGLIPLINLTLALLVSGLVIALIGEDPVKALDVMIQGAFVYPGSLGYTLYYTTNFIFTGLAVAVAFHAMLFNIGGEGQAMLGGLGVALVCLALDPFLPGFIVILAAIGGVIEQHMISIGFIAGEGLGLKADPKAQNGTTRPKGKACSSCGSYEMRMIEGCMTCASCGHSKCG